MRVNTRKENECFVWFNTRIYRINVYIITLPSSEDTLLSLPSEVENNSIKKKKHLHGYYLQRIN